MDDQNRALSHCYIGGLVGKDVANAGVALQRQLVFVKVVFEAAGRLYMRVAGDRHE